MFTHLGGSVHITSWAYTHSFSYITFCCFIEKYIYLNGEMMSQR